MTTTADRSRTWDGVVPVRRFQPLLVTLGLLALLPGLAASALRLFPPTEDGPALLASFIPYGLFGYLVAAPFLIIALIRSRRGRLALGGDLSDLCRRSDLPALQPGADFRSGPAAGHLPTLHADQPEHAGERRRPGGTGPAGTGADLVVLVEATPEGVARLERYGWSERFRYVAGAIEDGSSGSVIYSRFPLSDSAALPRSSFLQWAATADVPEVGPVRVLGVHPCNPYCGGNRWTSEHAQLRSVIADQDAGVPLIVAGDFNAIDDHGPMMALRADGLRSATDVAGSGWLPTYPGQSADPAVDPHRPRPDQRSR